jgi:hypothetical protein
MWRIHNDPRGPHRHDDGSSGGPSSPSVSDASSGDSESNERYQVKASCSMSGFGSRFRKGFGAFRDGLGADVVVRVTGKEYKLHSLLLAFHSEFFKAAFLQDSGFLEAQAKVCHQPPQLQKVQYQLTWWKIAAQMGTRGHYQTV